MRHTSLITSLALLSLFHAAGVRAQLQFVSDSRPQCVFAGRARNISLLWRNRGDSSAEAVLNARVSQLTSATATTINEAPWKELRILPGQTIVETAAVDFPSVKAGTRFLVQWIESTNHILGSTEVLVYPTNLLAELRPLAGQEDGALGIFDPQGHLKPLLKYAKVDFIDLGNSVLEDFRGKLAIIDPFESKAQMDPALTEKIKTITAKGVAVVWIQPPVENSAAFPDVQKTQPSFYSVINDHSAAIIVQPELVDDLAGNPRSQLNLVHFCKLAMHPEPPALPGLPPP